MIRARILGARLAIMAVFILLNLSTVAAQAYFEDDFDPAPEAGWTAGGTNARWQVGTPLNVGPAAAYSPPDCYGVTIDGNYNVNRAGNDWLATPQIDLTTATNPVIIFYSWIETVEDADRGRVEINTGAGWEHLDPDNLQGNYDIRIKVGGTWGWWFREAAGSWKAKTFDLSAYAGNNVQIRFWFESNRRNNDRPGWYVDDIFLYESGPTDVVVLDPGSTAVGWPLLVTVEIQDMFGGRVTSDNSTQVWLTFDSVTAYVVGQGTPGDPMTVTAGVAVITVEDTVAETVTMTPHSNPALTENDGQGTFIAPLPLTFFDDLESGEGIWSVSGTENNLEWELGEPLTPPSEPAEDVTGEGVNCWGTNLNADYLEGDADEYLVTPPIDLTTATSPTLTFWTWHYTQNRRDGGIVQITTDGTWPANPVDAQLDPTNAEGNYDQTMLAGSSLSDLSAFTGDPTPDNWETKSFDLSAYIGNVIAVRFFFASDSGTNDYPGWFIDDIGIYDPPTDVWAVRPESVTYGTPMYVTLEVRDASGEVCICDNQTQLLVTLTESNPNGSASSSATAAPVTVKGGRATITVNDTEAETVTITPVVVAPVYSPPLTIHPADGLFVSTQILHWREVP